MVNDGSTDASAEIASSAGACVISTNARSGPAHARNLGAHHARGDLLVFIDSDVCVHPGTLARIGSRLDADATLAAVIGSYDDTPAEFDFLSQYKNLMHHYVHQRAGGPAATFWTGCGAIKKDVYLAMGGLDESYQSASIEDIDLGYRMAAAGQRIELDPTVQATHLKRWTLRQIVATDLFRRGIPWVRLILRSRTLPNHLNVSLSHRASVVSVWIAVLLTPLAPVMALLAVVSAVVLNLDFFRFLRQRRGIAFSVCAVPVHLVHYLCNGISVVVGALGHAWDAGAKRPARLS